MIENLKYIANNKKTYRRKKSLLFYKITSLLKLKENTNYTFMKPSKHITKFCLNFSLKLSRTKKRKKKLYNKIKD